MPSPKHILGLARKYLLNTYYEDGIALLKAIDLECVCGKNAIQENEIMIGDMRLMAAELLNDGPKPFSFEDELDIMAIWRPQLVPIAAVLKKA